MDRDANKSQFDDVGTYAINIATAVWKLFDTNRTTVYSADHEWKEGERVVETDDDP